MSTASVEFELSGSFGILRINRPTVHNAVDEDVMSRLETLLDEIEPRTEVRSLILTGAGDETFCAGGDLGYFADLPSRQTGIAMSRRMQALLNRLAGKRFFTIAAVNGQALGGGCEVLTACHFRIAAASARFSYRQAPNGLITGWGGGARLFRLVGRSQALRLLLTGERIDAGEALRIGLVDRVVAPGELLEASTRLAGVVGEQPATAVRAFLELASIAEGDVSDSPVDRETELFGDLWIGEDFRTVLSRFSKRRQESGG
jgi:enoyl-CoA hydratase/carnithine racemase